MHKQKKSVVMSGEAEFPVKRFGKKGAVKKLKGKK